MRKFLDVLELILFWIWLIGLVLLHIGTIGMIIQDFPEKFLDNLIFTIIGIAIWWGLGLGVSKLFKLKDRYYERKDRKAEQLYKEKYVAEVSIEDAFFGKMTFENDSLKECMEATELNFPKFGADVLDTLYIIDYNEADRERIFRSLQGIYEHQNEILDTLAEDLLEAAEEYEETDENGEPYTLEKIRERVYIWWTRLYNSKEGIIVIMEASLTEGELELGGHGIEAVINCADKTLEFTMEG